jgi:hypothetical protein
MPKVVRICPRRSCDDEKKKVPLHSGQGEGLLQGLKQGLTHRVKGGAVKQIRKDIKSHTHARVKLESSQKSSQAKSMYELKYMYLVYYEARGVIVTSLLLLMR